MPPRKAARSQSQGSPGPKRAVSAYLFFGKEKRAEVVAAHPDLPPKLVVAKLGELWKGLATEERAKYEAMALADKERYQREKQEFHSEVRPREASGQDSESSRPKKKPASSKKPRKKAD